MQRTKTKNAESKSSISPLVHQFNEIKNKVIEDVSTTRLVKLSYKSCCGCGCDYVDIIRTVDSDSRLQDGDIVTQWLVGDEYAD